MAFDLSLAKFKILFINIFIILFKAATLSPTKLHLNLLELKCALTNSCGLSKFFAFPIGLLLITKFFCGYLSLAANVIAIFPILADEQPELLLPSIIALAFENVLLSVIELLLGYVVNKYYLVAKMPIFIWFVSKLVVKILLSVSMLNIYSDWFHRIKFPMEYRPSEISLKNDYASERLIKKQTLS